ncbi:hypothetical protein [Borrelia miyamotoi]|uniref:hypothetical protein n=1 Tax=Borrelia miyamotoi TaxID=47466 RepID=UPI001562700C|nr:hypothetical protein [Borrelia miyamotoi]ATQ18936.2 hypothetical protein CNO11_05100 [Borrelia miyamotoi]ATQ19010.2 hypothetical protein CNO11_05565 [Borrelia miyamotoi]ATQ19053.2 hypothetical protein CNO11_05815 [Borrelia miyamotoi]WVI05728.1 hypothetical protein F9Y91_02620 [Borrelia miyamotoi]
MSYYNVFSLKFLFILFLFSCKLNTQKVSNTYDLQKNINSIITQDINQNPKPSHGTLTNGKVVQEILEKKVIDKQKEKLQEDKISSDKLRLKQQISSEQTRSIEVIKKSTEEQLNNDSTQSIPLSSNKQVEVNAEHKRLKTNESLLKETSISTVSTLVTSIVVESIPKPEEEAKKRKKSNPELRISDEGNQQSFKEYKIQDTRNANANGAMMYEISLGIKNGNITNNSFDYDFNNNWKLFFAKFNNGSIFVITNNNYWGSSFRLSSSSNYINDGEQGIGLDLEQNHLLKFKNAVINGNKTFQAITYDDMENDINIKVNKSDNSDYIFLKFEVTNTDVNISDNEEEEFDSFNKITSFLSEKSFAIKKSDFNNFINIIE